MRKRVYRNYVFAICICLALLGLGQLPYLFIAPKDAAVLQAIYYLVVLGIALLMTATLAIVRFSYNKFNKSSLPYCLAGIINTALPSIGLYYILGAGWSVWVLFLSLVLLVGILINRDILRQLNIS